MTITEKVAYLKGLAAGVKLSDSTDEGKLFTTIIDVLEDMSLSITDLEDSFEELSGQVDEIDDDLGVIEEDFYGDDDEDLDDEDFEDTLYEVECPSCGDKICLDEGMLEEGEIECPGCGEKLEFDFDDDCGCDDCNCDCGHDHE
ncbi:MAG: hypothetical protein VB100_07980 [Angelakisella sp.]|nr:hypothetical protein [Angelakisella sp.]